MDEGTNIVMVNSAGEVLLYLRDDKPTIKFPNTWCLPGGYVEPGEQPHECITREIDLELDQVVLTEGQRLKWFTRAEISAHELGYEDNAILADFFDRQDRAALR